MNDAKAIGKGMLVVMSGAAGAPYELLFQYNPATVRRRLAPHTLGGEPDGRSEQVRYTATATETIDLEIEIDALDPLPNVAQANAARELGVFPQLYALETLLSPSTSSVAAANAQLASGTLEIAPTQVPLVLLVLGGERVAPVIPTSYQVTEQAFDPNLAPIRASVELSLRVLSSSDVAPTAAAYSRFITYQKGKESAAAKARTKGSGPTSG